MALLFNPYRKVQYSAFRYLGLLVSVQRTVRYRAKCLNLNYDSYQLPLDYPGHSTLNYCDQWTDHYATVDILTESFISTEPSYAESTSTNDSQGNTSRAHWPGKP